MTNECPRTRELFAPLEAALMVAPESIPAVQLAEVVNAGEAFALKVLEDFAVSYWGEDGGREYGFELGQSTRGWRIYSTRPWVDLVGRFTVGSATPRLSQATLEILAVVAYC